MSPFQPEGREEHVELGVYKPGGLRVMAQKVEQRSLAEQGRVCVREAPASRCGEGEMASSGQETPAQHGRAGILSPPGLGLRLRCGAMLYL